MSKSVAFINPSLLAADTGQDTGHRNGQVIGHNNTYHLSRAEGAVMSVAVATEGG